MLAETKKVENMNYFELLAWLGIGSSHPGGFPATRQNIDILKITPEEFILDAGCGSGLTACYLAKTIGCKIVGIDINTQMIEKARLRAAKEGVTHLVEFKVADVYNLPFPSNCFDLVIAESITVFLDKIKAYQEFYRVLKPEGRVADLEMALLKDLSTNVRDQLHACFGPSTNPVSFDEWIYALEQAGFKDIEIKNPQPLRNQQNLVMSELKKDWVLIKNLAEKITKQPALLPRLQRNAQFMKNNLGYFGYGLVFGRKPTPKKLGIKERLLQIFYQKRALFFEH